MKSITIGRANENDVTLTDMSVSRQHAQIVQTDNGTFTITDFNSRNGTFVNGQRIYGSATLRGNDMVRLGDSNFSWQKYFGQASSDHAPTQQAMGGGGYGYNQVYVQNIQNVSPAVDPQPQAEGANAFAILGFIFSFFVPLLGLIFSIIGLSKAKKMNGKGRGLAAWGLALSIIYFVVVIVVCIIYFAALGALLAY
jgi:hypothetical protein